MHPTLARFYRPPKDYVNFSPEFYDNLPTISLTFRALKELGRRNYYTDAAKPVPVNSSIDVSRFQRRRGPLTRALLRDFKRKNSVIAFSRSESAVLARDLASFAKRGGPDISDLRQFPYLEDPYDFDFPLDLRTYSPLTMPGNPSAKSPGVNQSEELSAVAGLKVVPKIQRVTAYDANFERHMVANGIYPPLHNYGARRPSPEPRNLAVIVQAVSNPRTRNSFQLMTNGEFLELKRNARSPSEGLMMRTVIPTMINDKEILNQGNLPFTNLKSMTGETTAKPAPDFWDGALAADLDQVIQRELSSLVVPTKHSAVPVAPNFFLETKSSSGGEDVAMRQVLNDGAYGARAMQSLQSYGLRRPKYDGNAYTFSSTCYSGYLILYAHHISAPTANRVMEYHMTEIDQYSLTRSPAHLQEAVNAFRNLREYAQAQRDRLIKEANARVKR